MSFELFKRQMAPLAKSPFVTIQRRGNISLNASAVSALGSPKAVELLFDRENRFVALRAADVQAEHAYPVRQSSPSANSYLVAAMAFMDFYGVDTAKARRYVPNVVESLLVIDLNGPFTEIISNRTRARDNAASDTLNGEPGLQLMDSAVRSSLEMRNLASHKGGPGNPS